MSTKFENLSCEIIMIIMEYIDNPLMIFFNLNSYINQILSDHRIKLNIKIENDQYKMNSLPINLTRLIWMDFKGQNLRRFNILKSLTLFINENMISKFKLPLSLEYFKIHFHNDISSLLFQSLPTLTRLQTLIINSKKLIELYFPIDTTIFNRNIKILQLKNISTVVSSIYDCEELGQLKYLELQLCKIDELFHNISFSFPSLLKSLIIRFQLSFTNLEYLLNNCMENNLKRLELYTESNIPQLDYFDGKRWCKLFERFQTLTKCRIELTQKGQRGIYNNIHREFTHELQRIKELKEKWNMNCFSCCPGKHGTTLYIRISAKL